jgi:MucB/RseB N-terminal domain
LKAYSPGRFDRACPTGYRRWLLALSLALGPVAAVAASETFRGAGFDETLSGEPVLAVALTTARLSPAGMPILVRLIVERAEVERQPGAYDFDALDARMALYGRLGVRTYLDLRDAPPAAGQMDAWGRFVRAVASRYRTLARGYIFGAEIDASLRPLSQDYAFYVKSTVVNLRAGDESASATLRGIRDSDAGWLTSLYGDDVAPYLDAIGLESGSRSADRQAVLATVEGRDPTSSVVLLGQSLGDDPSEAPRRFLDGHLETLASRITGITYAAPQAAAAALLGPIAALRDVLGQELVALDDAAVGLRLVRTGTDVTALVRHRLLFGVASSATYFVYSDPEGSLELTLSERTGARPVIRDALGNTRRPARTFAYDSDARTARVGLDRQSWPLVVDWSTAEGPSWAAREEVSGTALPSVAEVIARHQQAQAAQDTLLTSYIANAAMEQHFRTTAADPGFDVVTENRFFVQGTSTEWEELSFRLNGTRWGPKRPPFPLLQAEKVLSLPLDLRLNTDYRYRLEGVEAVNGRECYAVRFDPVDEQRSLYRGTVWIDRETYLKAKVQTVQTRLAAPVVSNEEIQHFASAGVVAGREIHLLARLVGRQIMLIAGRNLLVERTVRFDGFRLNPADFVAQRQASRGGDNIMYRDTEAGLRYLVKRDGERVVQEKTTRSATAAALGVTYDPAYDYPLPIVGINYLDFHFLGEENQLAVLFAGVLALANVQRPKLLGEHVDGSLDLFAIAIKGNDRTYDQSGELEEQRLRTLPFSTGINLGWRVAEFHKLVASYQFRFDAYSPDETTAKSFVTPVDTVTNGFGLSWEWKRWGYAFVAGGTGYKRAEWEPWGAAGDYDPAQRDYFKYSTSLSKDFYFGLHKIHLNAAYYGGRDLDRFSMYQFGFFDDNRVHGVPSSGVRFAELGMFRGSYSFNLFDQYRLDLFFDQAYGRNPSVDSRFRAVTGLGLGFNVRGPWNTLLRGDFGKSFLPSEYRKPGSVVFQFQVLKPL